MMVDMAVNARAGNRVGRMHGSSSYAGTLQSARASQPSVSGLCSNLSIGLMRELQDAARQSDAERRQRALEAFALSLTAVTAGPLSSLAEMPLALGREPMETAECSWQAAERVGQPVVASLLRLSVACPFEDVRRGCTALLDAVARNGGRVPRPLRHAPSCFLPRDQLSLTSLLANDVARQALEAKFQQTGRLENYVQVLALQPDYLKVFLRMHSHLLYADDLPLQYAVRHYIAIMASARYDCTYLVNLHATEFLLNNGDQNWLRGLEHIPQKLRDLLELNKLLAHRPWLIKPSHIEHLLSNENSFKWSLSELVHAIVLLAHIHALCSFVYSCGIVPELDQNDGHTNRHVSRATHQLGSENGLAEGENLENGGGHRRGATGGDLRKLAECNSPDEANNNAHGRSATSPLAQSMPLAGSGKPKKSVSFSTYYSPNLFNDDPAFEYGECDRRRPSQSIVEQGVLFESRNWDNALALISSLCSDALSESIEARTLAAQELPDGMQNDQMEEDASAFQCELWNTVHSLYGVRHEDYNYVDGNRLLDRALRSWIKHVACFPQLATEKGYRGVLQNTRHTEKVHVNLMVLEARMQAALLYALRAIQDYRRKP